MKVVLPKRSLKGRHVVVTGGAGFIGSHLVDSLLLEEVRQLTIIDNLFLGSPANLTDARRLMPDLYVLYMDASDNSSMCDVFSRLPAVDVVFDLAMVPYFTSLEQPQFCFDTNVRITSVLCELLRHGHFESLIHFSSSEAYGNTATGTVAEDHALRPTTTFACAKAASDHLVRAYAATYAVEAFVVRPFNIYGPRQHYHYITGVIPRLVSCALEGRAFPLFGDGEQTRDYLFVTDAVRAALDLYKCSQAWGQAVNIASGEEMSICILKKKIEHILERTISCEQCEPSASDIRHQRADTTLLKNLVKFEPLVSIDTGLSQTVEFFVQQEASVGTGGR